MYFWRIELLKKQLIERGITESQHYCYILIYVALSAISVELMRYFPDELPNAWTYLGSIINAAIPIFGTMLIFRANGGVSGVQFAARYFSIGLVATIRFLVLLIPLMAVLMIYWFSSYDSTDEIPSGATEIVLFSTWYALLYAYIAKHVREIAQA